ncbi:MAG: hypothetical protein VZR36_12050 [Prevotella sp.]|nr:hypothetical protein [Prevotella sp.]
MSATIGNIRRQMREQRLTQKEWAAKSGYDAKKAVRTKYEDSFGQEDWQAFNVEWMMSGFEQYGENL